MSTNTNYTGAMEWAEDRGASRCPLNLVSICASEEFYTRTKLALPWEGCGDHDEGRVVLPSVYLERLFAQAPTEAPDMFNPEHKVLTKCIDVAYLRDGVEELKEAGLFKDDEAHVEYVDCDELYRRADQLVKDMPDNQVLKFSPASLEWLRRVRRPGGRQGT